MRFLVTGGCGFIGSHIAEALVGRGHSVTILDDLSSGYERNIEKIRAGVTFVKGDIRDTAVLESAMQGIEGVFHEAALVSVFSSVENPLENHDINITGTLNVLEAARKAGVRRVLMAGSAAAYGNNPDMPKRETMLPEPESPYALAKLAGEHYMTVFAKLYGLQTVILRYFNVYGPRQDPDSMYSGVISRFADCVLHEKTPLVFGDGKQTRDFVYVGDVVQANLLAMEKSELGSGEVINVGTGAQVSLLDLLGAFEALAGRDLAPEFRDARAGDVRDSVADISRAREWLGYEPQFTIEAGLKELIADLRK